MSTKTNTTITVAQVADKLGMSPKVARRKLRDAWDNLPASLRTYVEHHGWVFTKSHVARVTAVLGDKV